MFNATITEEIPPWPQLGWHAYRLLQRTDLTWEFYRATYQDVDGKPVLGWWEQLGEGSGETTIAQCIHDFIA